ncbi:MAG: thiamine pyrophosphate-dependent enzyme [Candidatus Shapirobacteria bacterium]
MSLSPANPPTWCPGCHNFLIYAGIRQAVATLNIPAKDMVFVYDIGCVGNMADNFSSYAIHSLHGRCVPTALGVRLANPKLKVVAVGGDGGIYGEGLNHLLATARANYPLTVLVANNQLYSLTTGQTSPTTPQGSRTKSTPLGSPSLPVDPITLINASNPNAFVKSVSGTDPKSVIDAISEALAFPGFSLVDIRQVCITFGKQIHA